MPHDDGHSGSRADCRTYLYQVYQPPLRAVALDHLHVPLSAGPLFSSADIVGAAGHGRGRGDGHGHSVLYPRCLPHQHGHLQYRAYPPSPANVHEDRRRRLPSDPRGLHRRLSACRKSAHRSVDLCHADDIPCYDDPFLPHHREGGEPPQIHPRAANGRGDAHLPLLHEGKYYAALPLGRRTALPAALDQGAVRRRSDHARRHGALCQCLSFARLQLCPDRRVAGQLRRDGGQRRHRRIQNKPVA